MKRQGYITYKVIDVINDKTPEQMQQIINQTIQKIHDPLSNQYQIQKQSIITCLQQLDKLLVSEEEYSKRIPIMTHHQIIEKESELNNLQNTFNVYSQTTKAENTQKQNTINEMKATVMNEQASELQLQNELKTKENELNQLQIYTNDDLIKKQMEGERRKKDAEIMKNKKEESIAKLEMKRNEFTTSKNEAEELKKTIKEIEDKMNKGKERLSELEIEERRLQREYEQKKREMENEILQLDRKARGLENEVDGMKKRITELSDELGIEPQLMFANEENAEENVPVCYEIDDDDLLF